MSIGETEGVGIVTKHVSMLSCVSLAYHEIAVVIRTRVVAPDKMRLATQPAVLESISRYFDDYVTVT